MPENPRTPPDERPLKSRRFDLRQGALGSLEDSCFAAAHKHGRHGRASVRITDRGTKEHECDMTMVIDLLEGSMVVTKTTPEGRLTKEHTADLFAGYE